MSQSEFKSASIALTAESYMAGVMSKSSKSVASLLNGREAELFTWIRSHLGNNDFASYHGLGRCTKCTCSRKQPCKMLLDDDAIFQLLKNHDGRCASCNVGLYLFERSASRQPLPVFTLPSFQPNRCKTRETVPYALCHGCAALLEACYYDRDIFNGYRKLLFSSVGGDKVAAPYFPRLDYADKARNVPVPSLKNVGKKQALHKQWLRQRGFVVYPLPDALQGAVLQDKLALKRVNEAAWRAARHQVDDNDSDDEDGEPQTEQAPEEEAQKKKDKAKAANADKTATATDKDKPELVKKRAAAKRQKKSHIHPSEMCDENARFVTFTVPIDPRKSSRNKSLLYLALTPAQRNHELSPDNYLITTKLLTLVEQKLEYGEFIRWALATFRRQVPQFVASTPSAHAVALRGEAGVEELRRLQASLMRERQLRLQNKQNNKDIKTLKTEQEAFHGKWAEKLLHAYEANEDLAFLEPFDLVPKAKQRAGGKREITPDFVASCLPALMAKHGLVKDDPQEMQRVFPLCKALTKELFSEELRGTTPPRISFTLTLRKPRKPDETKKEKKDPKAGASKSDKRVPENQTVKTAAAKPSAVASATVPTARPSSGGGSSNNATAGRTMPARLV